MKVLHIVEDFSIKSGGLRTVVNNLNLELQNRGFSSYILSSDKEIEDVIYLVEAKNKPWMFSKDWKHKMNQIIIQKKINVIHIHGVWLYPQYIAAKYAIQKKIPFVLSIHGMYEPWLWQQGTLKKKLYFRFLVKKKFIKASVFHTITPFETLQINKLFNKPKTVEIPNLIHVPKNKFQFNNDEKYILYLGRLDKKKGIQMLIEAFSRIKNTSFYLKIAGEINDYKKELEKQIKELKLEKRICFLGMVKGDEKKTLIKNAFILVTPSYSEVIGMVNLEAAILKTPVITTFQTGLNKEWNNNGGKLINPNSQELQKAIEEALSWSLQKRNEEGEKLFQFVKKNYSWERQINDWILLYNTAKKNV